MRFLAAAAAILSVCGAHAESRYVLPFFGGPADRLYVTSAQDGATVEVCGAAGCAERPASPPDAVRPAAVDLDGIVGEGRQRVTVTSASDVEVEVVAVRRGPPIVFLPVRPAPPAEPEPELILLKSEVAAVAAGDGGWVIPPPGAACSHLAPGNADRRAVFFAIGPTAKVRPARSCIATEPRPHVPPGVRRYAVWWQDAHGGGVAAGDARLFFR